MTIKNVELPYLWCIVILLPDSKEESTANSNSFKIAQKTAFEVKGRLYTTGKVIQRLFIIDLYTQLAIYGYRRGKRQI